jgi:hypothetical protein
VRAVPALVLFAVLAACRASLPDANGYLRVARVTGCGTPVTTGPLQIKNVLVGEELSDSLLLMLTGHEIDSPHCWYERSDGLLELDAGSVCEPSLFAYFRQAGSEWRLETVNPRPVVLCDERAR